MKAVLTIAELEQRRLKRLIFLALGPEGERLLMDAIRNDFTGVDAAWYIAGILDGFSPAKSQQVPA